MGKNFSLLAFYFLVLLAPVHPLSLSAGLDAASLLSFAYDDIAVSGELGLDLNDSLRLYAGTGWYSTDDEADDVRYVNACLGADYFPFGDLGLYAGISLADVFFPYGLDSDGRVRLTNHLRIGFAWRLPFFTLDMRLVLRDLASASAVDSVHLAGKIGQLGRVFFSCILSFRCDFARSAGQNGNTDPVLPSGSWQKIEKGGS